MNAKPSNTNDGGQFSNLRNETQLRSGLRPDFQNLRCRMCFKIFNVRKICARNKRSISATVELPQRSQMIFGGTPRCNARSEKSLSSVATTKLLSFAYCQTTESFTVPKP